MAKGPPAVEAFGPDNRTVIDRGTLLVVDNQVDQTTGTIKLKAEFPNKDLQLWPGQFVNVRLLIDTLQQVVVAPTAAVQRGPTGIFAFVVQPDNTVAVRPITVTQQTETQAVIATGLKPGERVVTTGFARLTAGSRVVVTNAEQVPPPGTEPAAAPRRRGPPEGRQRRSELPPGTRS
jgi:multidrug efflux system membrane fusion protein